MFQNIKRTLHPEAFQGKRKKPPYFEGWYFKLVDRDEQNFFAVIPGVHISADTEGNHNQANSHSHSFVQIFEGSTGFVEYKTYPLSAFRSMGTVFDIWIGPNHFTSDSISLNIDSPKGSINGNLKFTSLKPWPVSFKSPGIMGWYAWIPFLECFHGIVSLDHEIQGSLTVNSRVIDFIGGRGYIEKDWGKSFPDAWIWFQTNHFSRPGTSLTASMAIIPWLHKPFPGFIIGLWHDNQLYRFATYTGAKVTHLEISDTHIAWTVRDRHHILEMQAEREKGGLLHAPSVEGMDRRIIETLDSKVAITLTAQEKTGSRIIFKDSGRKVGLEAAGNLDRLIQMWKAGKVEKNRSII
jgi:tocopherol cyclase